MKGAHGPCLAHGTDFSNWEEHKAHFIMTLSNGNMFRVTGPLWGESTRQRWIPHTKASDAELWRFLWSAPKQTVEWAIETRWFETPSHSLWRHCHIWICGKFGLRKLTLLTSFPPKVSSGWQTSVKMTPPAIKRMITTMISIHMNRNVQIAPLKKNPDVSWERCPSVNIHLQIERLLKKFVSILIMDMFYTEPQKIFQEKYMKCISLKYILKSVCFQDKGSTVCPEK